MAEGPLILIIEDEAPIRRFLRASLTAAGYRLVEAESGQQGLQLARQYDRAIDRFILLTDIARSSYLAETFPEQYFAALQQHNHLVISAVERHGGEVLKCLGDGFLALFEDAVQAVDAAIEPVPAEWRCSVCSRVIPTGDVLRCCNRPAGSTRSRCSGGPTTRRRAGRIPELRSRLWVLPCFRAFLTRTPLMRK